MKQITVRQLFQIAKARILKNPAKYDQRTYCGTPCCIGGHIDIVLNCLRKHREAPFGYIIRDRVCKVISKPFCHPTIFSINFERTPFHGTFIEATTAALAIDWYLDKNPDGLDLDKKVAAKGLR
jgi:hypothetical protein